jgi:hypothetical protein
LLTGACKEGKEKQSMGEGDNGNIQIEVPSFNSDSAFQFVKVQTDFGPRVPNTEAHEQCAFYLLEQLHRFCDTAYIQSFDAIAYDKTILKSKNIVGSFLPEAQKRVLLGAHWDSRPMADYDPKILLLELILSFLIQKIMERLRVKIWKEIGGHLGLNIGLKKLIKLAIKRIMEYY